MGGPFFLPDVSAHQGPLPDYAPTAADPRMVGVIVKATQGVTYAPNWFLVNWPRVRAAGGKAYGSSWFRGCYHYATPAASGEAQADYLLDFVERAGGLDVGDLPVAWDLEGSAWSSRQQVIDASAAFAARVRARTGRAPILYTGATWRKFGIRDTLGFGRLWTTYTGVMAPYGWPDASYALWQFAGDDRKNDPRDGRTAGWPVTMPGLGRKADMNVVMDGGVPATSIDRVRAVLVGDEPVMPTFAPPAVAVTERPRSRVPAALGIAAGVLLLGAAAIAASSGEAS